jgi:hypothetical protein
MSATISRTLAAQVNRLARAIASAKSYAKELPKEAAVARAKLESLQPSILELNAQQERAKLTLRQLTRRLDAALKEASVERARIVRLAEATFGPRDMRLREFRAVNEGRLRVRAQKPATPVSTTATELKVA